MELQNGGAGSMKPLEKAKDALTEISKLAAGWGGGPFPIGVQRNIWEIADEALRAIGNEEREATLPAAESEESGRKRK